VALQLDTSSALAQHQRQHSQQRKHACAAKRKVRKAKKQKKKICGFFLVTKRVDNCWKNAICGGETSQRLHNKFRVHSLPYFSPTTETLCWRVLFKILFTSRSVVE
jgi:hypothetical protein